MLDSSKQKELPAPPQPTSTGQRAVNAGPPSQAGYFQWLKDTNQLGPGGEEQLARIKAGIRPPQVDITVGQ